MRTLSRYRPGSNCWQLDEEQAALARRRRVRAAGRMAQVGARRVVTGLVAEDAFEHQDLLAAAMHVPVEARPGRIAHQAGGTRHFVAHPVEHAPLDAGQR